MSNFLNCFLICLSFFNFTIHIFIVVVVVFSIFSEQEESDPVVYYRHFKTDELQVREPEDFKEQHRMGSLRASGRVLPRRQVDGRIELMDSRTGNGDGRGCGFTRGLSFVFSRHWHCG